MYPISTLVFFIPLPTSPDSHLCQASENLKNNGQFLLGAPSDIWTHVRWRIRLNVYCVTAYLTPHLKDYIRMYVFVYILYIYIYACEIVYSYDGVMLFYVTILATGRKSSRQEFAKYEQQLQITTT